MALDTTDINKSRGDLHELDEIWLFGYGSIIYKVDFPYLEKARCYIKGWQRKFWQGSHDHRGTPQDPGRVVTLIETQEQDICQGMGFRVTPEEFEHLDHREKNGYLRYQVPLFFNDEGKNHHTKCGKTGIVYIAPTDNAAFLGPASVEQIAMQIARCHGPSGPNKQYLLELANALRQLDIDDPHVFAIEQTLLSLQ